MRFILKQLRQSVLFDLRFIKSFLTLFKDLIPKELFICLYRELLSCFFLLDASILFYFKATNFEIFNCIILNSLNHFYAFKTKIIVFLDQEANIMIICQVIFLRIFTLQFLDLYVSTFSRYRDHPILLFFSKCFKIKKLKQLHSNQI